MNNDTVSKTTVYAAGGVMWRIAGGRLRVLVVHRDSRGDVSFPKGKIKPGEILAETAVREVHEETGIAAVLGPPVDIVAYTLPGGRDKVVHYWSMRAKDRAVRESTFAPNREISAVEWLTPEVAFKRLTYPFDREVLETFLEQFESGAQATFPVIAVRHATATSRGDWPHADHLRPLSAKGEKQAKALAGELAAFGVRKIVSSTATRCLQTVTPLSKALGRPIAETEAISQDAWEDGLDDIAGVVDQRISAGKGAVVCSHGPVLPGILSHLLSSAHPGLREIGSLETGAFTVAHVSKDPDDLRVVAVESHRALV